MSDDKKEYPRPSLTADIVVVALGQEHGLSVLLIERAHDPFQGKWALPGGFVEPTETVAQAAARELEEETALRDVRLVELGCFSRPGRDPRGWVVTVAHLGLVPRARLAQARAGDDAAKAAWLDLVIEPGGGFSVSHQGTLVHRGGALAGGTPSGRPTELPSASGLAFDHGDILATAVERLRDRVGELAFDLLPQPFQLPTARRAFEAILGAPIDPAKFQTMLLEGVVHSVTEPGSTEGADIDFVAVSHRRSPWLGVTTR